jgi:uncharacterized protein (TIGR02186 family)
MMVKRIILTILLCLFCAPVAMAQPAANLNIDLSERSIDITTGFNGAKIVVYGTRRGEGDIAMIMRGPEQSIVMRRKSRVLGVWMNSQSMRFNDVPGFYALALSRSASEIAPLSTLRRYNIGLDALEFDADDSNDAEKIDTFREALIRTQQMKGLYPLEPGPINFVDKDFFKVTFKLPSNVPAGIYRVDTFVLRDGIVTDTRSAELKVAQNGFSAEVFLFAHNQSLAYAVIAILIALFFGWGAHSLLRRD